MSKSDPDQSSTTEAIREQFEFLPYPDIAIDQPFKGGRELLFRHNLTTPFYRKDQQLKLTEGSRILDAGCGTGYKALVLANANPGASIVGVDISEKSVSIAKQRLDHHGFGNTAFHVVPLEDIASIGQEFDYINCDETLYLLLNPQLGLEAMRSVLKPGGVLRVNFHSQFQRMDYFRAQQVGQLLGALTHTDQEAGIGLFRSAMQALKRTVPLRKTIWENEEDTDNSSLLANHLLRGDKGTTIPSFFEWLESAGLEFISMVDWQSWNLMSLFKDADHLPEEIAAILASKSASEKFYLFELLCPNHRLLDVWCGHQHEKPSWTALQDWKKEDWSDAVVYLHPQLRDKETKDSLRASILSRKPLDFYELMPLPGATMIVDTTLQACLLPLWDSPKPFLEIVEQCGLVHPVNPVTLAPMHRMESFIMMKRVVMQLTDAGYLMVCRGDRNG